LVGAWDVLFLGFASCPDMCPMTMKKMAMANSNLSEEASSKINFRMISVDPDRDTPEKMQEYAEAFSPSFTGITGDIEVIYKLATDLTLPFVPVVASDISNYDMDHSMNLAVIDPNGNYFGFFKSPHSPEKMAEVLESIVAFN
jgi:protein SCO1/2